MFPDTAQHLLVWKEFILAAHLESYKKKDSNTHLAECFVTEESWCCFQHWASDLATNSEALTSPLPALQPTARRHLCASCRLIGKTEVTEYLLPRCVVRNKLIQVTVLRTVHGIWSTPNKCRPL